MTNNTHFASAGFTLIETIVALVILAAAVAVFANFLSTHLAAAGRVEAAAEAYDRQMNALEIASAINPMVTPDGSFDLGTYRIGWSSQLLGEVNQSSRYPAGRGNFKVALYRIIFNFSGDLPPAPIAVTRLGYRRDDVPSLLGSGN